MSRKLKLLIVEDDIGQLTTITNQLRTDFQVVPTQSIDAAKKALDDTFDLILSDIRLLDKDPANKDGIKLLAYVKNEYPQIPVVMMTAYGDQKILLEALRLGASDFLPKPIQLEKLPLILDRVFEKERLRKENLVLKSRLERFDPSRIIGESPQIKRALELVSAYAQTDSTILIHGETGVGKELVAKALHRNSPRKDKPFITVNVAEFNRELMGSELFGHKKGAFTGSIADRRGLLDEADEGILFIDEIGELPREIQIKLIRFIETKSFRKVGTNIEKEVDVQLVVATNKDLQEAIKSGEFREDFYHRINVLTIDVAPLRERTEDILILADHFLKLFRTTISELSEEVKELFLNYAWPGNVRELKNIIEYAIIQANLDGSNLIKPHHLRGDIIDYKKEVWSKNRNIEMPVDLSREVAKLELRLMEAALKKVQGKKGEAWKLLGLNDRHALRRRLEATFFSFPDILQDFPYIKQKYKSSK